MEHYSYLLLPGTAQYGSESGSQAHIRVDMVGTIHDDLLAQWRYILMGQFRANIFLIRTTYFQLTPGPLNLEKVVDPGK